MTHALHVGDMAQTPHATTRLYKVTDFYTYPNGSAGVWMREIGTANSPIAYPLALLRRAGRL